MGVEYSGCDVCHDSVYEEYAGSCTNCGNRICTSCVIDDDNIDSRYAHHYGYRFDSQQPELMKEYELEGFYLYDENGEPEYADGDLIDESSIAPTYCPFCEGVEVDRDEVLNHLLAKYSLDLKEVWDEIRNK